MSTAVILSLDFIILDSNNNLFPVPYILSVSVLNKT